MMPDAHPSPAGPPAWPLLLQKQVLKCEVSLSAFVSSKHQYLAPITSLPEGHCSQAPLLFPLFLLVIVTPSTSGWGVGGKKEPPGGCLPFGPTLPPASWQGLTGTMSSGAFLLSGLAIRLTPVRRPRGTQQREQEECVCARHYLRSLSPFLRVRGARTWEMGLLRAHGAFLPAAMSVPCPAPTAAQSLPGSHTRLPRPLRVANASGGSCGAWMWEKHRL